MNPNPRYVENMWSVFANLLKKHFGCQEVYNLELLEVMLRVICDEGSFSRALDNHSHFKKRLEDNKLIYPFGEILKLVEQISLMKRICSFQLPTEPFCRESQKTLEKTVLQLQRSDHPVCSFWYEFGFRIYSDYLIKSGQRRELEMLTETAKSKFYLWEVSMPWRSLQSCSSIASTATIREILEVSIADVTFDFALFAEESISPEVCSSADLFTSGVTSAFGVPPDNFRKFASERLNIEELIEHLIPERTEAQLLIFIQVSS